jgi:hypothetical protein
MRSPWPTLGHYTILCLNGMNATEVSNPRQPAAARGQIYKLCTHYNNYTVFQAVSYRVKSPFMRRFPNMGMCNISY